MLSFVQVPEQLQQHQVVELQQQHQPEKLQLESIAEEVEQKTQLVSFTHVFLVNKQ